MGTSGLEALSRCRRLSDFSKKALRHGHFLHGSQKFRKRINKGLFATNRPLNRPLNRVRHREPVGAQVLTSGRHRNRDRGAILGIASECQPTANGRVVLA